jgi:hypothetical protein
VYGSVWECTGEYGRILSTMMCAEVTGYDTGDGRLFDIDRYHNPP